MSKYNIIQATVECSCCKNSSLFDIELFVGDKTLEVYNVGDTYRWLERKAYHNSGPPDTETIQAEGYTECPICFKDHFVDVTITGSIIQGACIKNSKPGYNKCIYNMIELK